MAIGQLEQAAQYSRFLAEDDSEPDRELLLRYARQGDQRAFALLVDRHGGMVLAVCRRLLCDPHEAEDAFQATFLVLAQRAGAVNWSDGVGGWLHAVARKVAARARSRRRPVQLGGLEAVPAPEAPPDGLLAELDLLPEKHRAPLVLVHLEGLTNAQAARVLGIPEGSMSKRLAQARDALRQRLESRGLAPANLPLLVAAVPQALRQAALTAAGLLSAGAALTSVTTATVAALAQGVISEMTRSNLKTVLLLALTAGVLLAGAGLAGLHLMAADKPAPKAPVARVEPPPRARTFKSSLPFMVYQIIDGEPIKMIGQTGPGIARAVQIPAGANWAVQPIGGVGFVGGGGFGGGFGGAIGMPPGGGKLGQFGNLGGGAAFGGRPPRGGVGKPPAPPVFSSLSGDSLKKLIAEMKKQNIPGLVLGGPTVTAEDFAKLAAVPRLRTLVLMSGSGVGDDHLAKLSAAKSLRFLSMQYLPVTEAGLKYLARAAALTELQLIGDGLDSKALKALAELKNLEGLVREKSPAETDGLPWLKSLPRLKKLELAGNYGDSDLKVLKEMTSLEVVRLRQTAITDDTVDNLKGNKGLRALVLDGHWGLIGMQPLVLVEAGKLKWVMPGLLGGGGAFGVGGGAVGGGGLLGVPPGKPPAGAGALGGLGKLGVAPPGGVGAIGFGGMPGAPAAPRFTARALEKLAGFEKLTDLEVHNNKLKDADVAPLARLKELRRLTLFAPEVGDTGVKELKALKKLQYLDLRGTDMTVAAAAALRALPTLKVVKVNVVTGGDATMKKKLATWKSALPRTRVVPIQTVMFGGFGAGGLGGFGGVGPGGKKAPGKP